MNDAQSQTREVPPAPWSSSCLSIAAGQLALMVSHCIGKAPEEACGLLVGDAAGVVSLVQPTRNVARSAQLYTVDPAEYLRADRHAEEDGQAVIGVFHSHTHTDPWPSPTDVRQAPDPGWHYVIVGLRHEVASTRSYRIVDGNILEESVVVLD